MPLEDPDNFDVEEGKEGVLVEEKKSVFMLLLLAKEIRELSPSTNQNPQKSTKSQSSQMQEKGEQISSKNQNQSPEPHHKMQGKRELTSPTVDTGKGRSRINKKITHGYHSVEGKTLHLPEDYVFAQFKQVDDNELGLFAVFDGHSGREVPDYLRSHLFNNIINEHDFWTEPEKAIKRAYEFTDSTIMNKAIKKRKGGSTAVTAILINCETLVVANVGDSRAVLCQDGVAKQLSVDHEPNKERKVIEEKGGFVTEFPGDCPRVDGSLAMSRAFGDKRLKEHISSEPDVWVGDVDDDTEFLMLASDGVWKVMSNQEAVDCVKDIEDPRLAAKEVIREALARRSRDDISCIVTRTVQVGHLSDLATEREIHEFFSFSGEIEQVEICRDSEQSKTAFVTFKDPRALEIALLLSGATIVDQIVSITPAENYMPKPEQDVREVDMAPENSSPPTAESNGGSPRSGNVYMSKAQVVVSSVLAKGSAIRQDAVNKAKAFDEKHQLRANASARVNSFDKRVRLSEKFNVGVSVVNEKVKSVDQKLQVSDKTMAALMAAERKLNDTGSAVKSSRYVTVGAVWLNGAFGKVAKAGEVARTKTRQKWNLAVSNLTTKVHDYILQLVLSFLSIQFTNELGFAGFTYCCIKSL
ncbi:hypothetical protein SSX86_018664 [Deinandra increscens subsp. villosa]|uniref:protein-serine/threonine phosphatase n=1 Tax=Deinandra increscens subsp. villosa TaxID=3103831 RepID=A0AAP0GSC3_9ASTR